MKIKSSKCGTNACVEVDMISIPNVVHVFDEHGNLCVYTHDEWKAFIAGVKEGEFDIT